VFDVWHDRYAQANVAQTMPQRPEQVPFAPLSLGPAGEVPLAALGAGSDFCPFFDHAGVPAIDVSFTGSYGVYHSLYDDFYWMQRFGDPTFQYETTLARVLGVLALRLDEADILPFNYPEYASEISEATDALAASPGFGTAAAGLQDSSQDVRTLSNSSAQFMNAAAIAAQALKSIRPGTLTPDKEAAINRALVDVEQAFLSSRGLPGRPWYKHVIFAPGNYTGYAAEIFPGISEALSDDPQTFGRQVTSLENALHRASADLDQVTQLATGSN